MLSQRYSESISVKISKRSSLVHFLCIQEIYYLLKYSKPSWFCEDNILSSPLHKFYLLHPLCLHPAVIHGPIQRLFSINIWNQCEVLCAQVLGYPCLCKILCYYPLYLVILFPSYSYLLFLFSIYLQRSILLFVQFIYNKPEILSINN